ncbi:YopX family protein [uncultured Capnocytophaga sp.]|uniref:YopX family protein n=1 Tax=uncultured Capnocytophaga sp. TaxID=159273 RepID=UPI00259A13A1|nr:YopX family protein [uncultured Capnocytophaga sp.]
MRTIKFRGQRFDKEFVYGYVQYFKDTDEYAIDDYAVNEDSISQFTGQYDKNGTEIYENDILKVKTNEGREYNPLLVVYSEVYGGFCLLSKNALNITPDKPHRPINPNWWDGFKDEIEVIGNIHDNPELLD